MPKIHKVYISLFVILFILICKICYDFYILENRQFSNSNLRESVESTEYIINNRGKIYYNNNLLYIQAERGYENEQNEFILENVIFNGDVGNGKAGHLLINNEMNIFTFTKNPEITIYLNR